MQLVQKLLILISSFFISVLPSKIYTEGVVDQPNSFFPNQALTQHEKTISNLLFRGLFKYDIYGTLLPDLAETWSISEDGIVYTIKLKDNQYWSSGKKITADDLIYSSFSFSDLTGVATDKVDELTVRYTLPNKYSPFLSLLTIGVIPFGSLENQDSLMPPSSGDFKVVGVERSGKKVVKVTLHTNNSKYEIQKIVFRYYSNEDELLTASKLGEIDGFVTEKDYSEDLVSFENYKFPLQGIYYALYLNLRNEKLQDKDLREGLTKVLPIDKIVSENGIEVQGPISRSVFTNRDIEFNLYDKEYIEKFEGTELVITIPDVQKHKVIADTIKRFWEDELDIDVKINEVNPENIVSEIIEKRDFEILLYGQEVGRDPDRYVNWHSQEKDPPGLNISGFESVRGDLALEEGRNEYDNEFRVIHYNELQEVIMNEIPAIFLYHPYVNFYVSENIEGIGEKYTFTYSDRFLDFFNWNKIEKN